MKTVYVPLIRQEGVEITTVSIIKFVVTDKTNESKVINKLTNVITQWVNNTEEGKKAWDDSSEDFNVGDLSSYEDIIKKTMSKELMKTGIYDFEIVMQGDSKEVINFDTILVDSSKLNSRNK